MDGSGIKEYMAREMEKQRQKLQQQHKMVTQKLERGMHEMRERLEKVKLEYPKTSKLTCFIVINFMLNFK